MPSNQVFFFRMLLDVLRSEGELLQNQRLVIATDFESRISELPIYSELYTKTLSSLKSTYDFPNNNGPKYDGLLMNHPQLGSRVIEFDEEQHFTPHRMKTIHHFYDHLPFSNAYETLFVRENVRLRSVKKLRLRNTLDINTFMDLERTNGKINEYFIGNNINNNFIHPARGFNYDGGRLAQRAVYDLMKDLFHVIEEGYEPIIRFSIFEFVNSNPGTPAEVGGLKARKMPKKSSELPLLSLATGLEDGSSVFFGLVF